MEVIKDSRSGKVVRRQIDLGDTTLDVYLKQPRIRNLRKLLFSAFRRSRSYTAFIMGHRLLSRRISTAIPLAALEQRTGPFLRSSILITEAIDYPHLNTFLVKWLGDDSEEKHSITAPERRELYRNALWQLGKMLRRLHDNNFFHRDLKATNIRIQRKVGNNTEIFLVDMDGVSAVWFMTMRRRFRDLMRLNVSLLLCPPVNNSGRLRMLLGYLRRPGSGRIHFKPIWRLLEKWSEAKLRKQISSRRRRQKEVRRPG